MFQGMTGVPGFLGNGGIPVSKIKNEICFIVYNSYISNVCPFFIALVDIFIQMFTPSTVELHSHPFGIYIQ